jgi:DNA-binding MarR family transcriptional regulator
MRSRLREELKQDRPFESPESEAYLEIQRTAQISARWIAGALRPVGLTPTQFNVLRILRGAGPSGHASGAIADRMVTPDSDLTRLLDRLESRGLVTKEREARDRRVVTVRVTAAGLDLVDRASQAVIRTLREGLGHLGPRRLASLIRLLERARQRED